MKSSQEVGEIAKALAKAQGAMIAASKDKDNPFFKSKYADLASCWGSCREQLASNNLAVVQTTSAGENNEVVIHTILMHESGQWLEGELPLKPVKNDPQGIGSAITYGRRYALMGMVGIAPADDDGEAAMGRGKASKNVTSDKWIEQVDKCKTYAEQVKWYNKNKAEAKRQMSDAEHKKFLSYMTQKKNIFFDQEKVICPMNEEKTLRKFCEECEAKTGCPAIKV